MSVEQKKAKILTRRTSDVYRHQRDRAKKAGVILDYTIDAIRSMVSQKIGAECGYCHKLIDEQTFSLDHDTPVSRGGAWTLGNLAVCCLRCNKIKGNMTYAEFTALLHTLDTFDEVARKDVVGRLYFGGNRFFGNRAPKKAA